jgi:hypothetical protein
MSNQKLKSQYLAILLVFSLASTFFNISFATDEGNETPPMIPVSPNVQKVIQEQGYARVIVALKVDFKPDDKLTLEERRVKITSVQDQFLNNLKEVFQPLQERRFAVIPHLAININQAALQYIVQHPLVTSVEMDTIQAPLEESH